MPTDFVSNIEYQWKHSIGRHLLPIDVSLCWFGVYSIRATLILMRLDNSKWWHSINWKGILGQIVFGNAFWTPVFAPIIQFRPVVIKIEDWHAVATAAGNSINVHNINGPKSYMGRQRRWELGQQVGICLFLQDNSGSSMQPHQSWGSLFEVTKQNGHAPILGQMSGRLGATSCQIQIGYLVCVQNDQGGSRCLGRKIDTMMRRKWSCGHKKDLLFGHEFNVMFADTVEKLPHLWPH